MTETILNFITDPIVQQLVPFAAGFAWSYGTPRDLVRYPFTSVLNGACGGAVAVFCNNLILNFTPDYVKPVLTLVVLASGTYYLGNSFVSGDHLELREIRKQEQNSANKLCEFQQIRTLEQEQERAYNMFHVKLESLHNEIKNAEFRKNDLLQQIKQLESRTVNESTVFVNHDNLPSFSQLIMPKLTDSKIVVPPSDLNNKTSNN